MATKLAAGSTRQFKDPRPKFYGIKISHEAFAIEGSIILKQRGNKYYPGTNVVQGRDFSLNATIAGYVQFERKKIKRCGKDCSRIYVSVNPA